MLRREADGEEPSLGGSGLAWHLPCTLMGSGLDWTWKAVLASSRSLAFPLFWLDHPGNSVWTQDGLGDAPDRVLLAGWCAWFVRASRQRTGPMHDDGAELRPTGRTCMRRCPGQPAGPARTAMGCHFASHRLRNWWAALVGPHGYQMPADSSCVDINIATSELGWWGLAVPVQ